MIRTFCSTVILFTLLTTALQAINFSKIEIANMSFVLIAKERPVSEFTKTNDLRYSVIDNLLKAIKSQSKSRVTIFLDFKYSFLNPSLKDHFNELDNQVFSSEKTSETGEIFSTYNNKDQYPLTARNPVVYSTKARILYGYLVNENTKVRSDSSIINVEIKNMDAIFYQTKVPQLSEKDDSSSPQADNTNNQDKDKKESSYNEFIEIKNAAKEKNETVYKSTTYKTTDDFIEGTRIRVISKIQTISPNFPNQYGALIEIYDSELQVLTYYLIGVYRGDAIKHFWTNYNK